jgi:diguanylate cyclase (GGDEF)-like protein
MPPSTDTDIHPHDPPRSDARDVRLHWAVAVGMLVAGAVTSAVTPLLPDPDPSDHGVYALTAALLALGGVALWAVGPRWPRLVRATPYVGILIVSTLVLVVDPVGTTPFFYLWPIINAAYFLDRRRVIGALLLFASTYGIALALRDDEPVALLLFVGGVICISLVAVVINEQRRRMDQLVVELRRSAVTDPLTGLPNRLAFEAALDRELLRVARTGQPLTIVMFDLDHFKSVNDRFGHKAGDRALRAVAAILDRARRGSDLVARLGGEEFVALLVDTDAEGGRRFYKRVSSFPELAGLPCGRLTLSAGVAQAKDGLVTRDDLLGAADRALYAAKAAGRSQVVVSEEGAACAPVP